MRMKTSPTSSTSRVQLVQVWDPFVRIFHWSLVACVLGNQFITEEGEAVHQWLGYAACSLVAMRFIWGFVGTPHARFSDFWPTPARVQTQIRSWLSGAPLHYQGHSPLGALMMLALMSLVLLLGLTGWLQGLDMFFGEEGPEEIHEVLANLLLILAGVHAVAAIVLSRLEKTNLIKAMITGVKRRSPHP
jgi:cytochrome b